MSSSIETFSRALPSDELELEGVLPSELSTRMTALARCLQIAPDAERCQSVWLEHAGEVMRAARASDIAPHELPDMAFRSIAWLMGRLPEAAAQDLDAELADAVERARLDLSRSGGGEPATSALVAELERVQRALGEGQDEWGDWASLARLGLAPAPPPALIELCRVAAALDAHPRFQAEMRELIEGVFECARLGLEEREQRLACGARESSDRSRTNSGARSRTQPGARRPELIRLCADLFGESRAQHALDAELTAAPQPAFSSEHRASEHRAPCLLGRSPPVGVFALVASEPRGRAAALARGVQRLLENPAATPVLDATTGSVRQLRADDIAVLTCSDEHSEAVARALSALGVPVAPLRSALGAVAIEDAVVLCTYLRAASVQRPVVILTGLGAAPPDDVVGVTLQTAAALGAPDRELRTCWIRYCPRPLAGTLRLACFEPEALLCEDAGSERRRPIERARLLHAGFRSAGEHLVLALECDGRGRFEKAWLDELRDADDARLLELPPALEAASAKLGLRGKGTIAARVWRIAGASSPSSTSEPAR